MAALGNRNAAKAKDWETALRKALAQHKTGQALRLIANGVVEKAIEGEWNAINEIGNRLDGKPVQGIEHSGSIERQTAQGMTDDELAAIAAGSSAGAVEQAPSTETLN